MLSHTSRLPKRGRTRTRPSSSDDRMQLPRPATVLSLTIKGRTPLFRSCGTMPMDWMSGPAGLGVVWMGTVWRRVGPRQLTSYTEEVRERDSRVPTGPSCAPTPYHVRTRACAKSKRQRLRNSKCVIFSKGYHQRFCGLRPVSPQVCMAATVALCSANAHLAAREGLPREDHHTSRSS